LKKLLVACSGAFLLVAACAQSGPGGDMGSAGNGGPGNGGSNQGTGGSSNPGNGGSSNQGTGGNDSQGTGGSSNPGNGGSSNGGSSNPGNGGNGVGGSNAGNGAGGSAGNGAGGTAGNGTGRGGAGGSAAGGTGGTNSSRGGAGGTGGSGNGGTTGRGGAAGTAAGGTGGSAAGGTGGGSCPTIDQLIPGLDGYLWKVMPSGMTPLSGTNYPFGDPSGAACPQTSSWATSGYINTTAPMAIKGTTGQKYTINISVRGVVGTRCYTGGTPGSTAAGNANGQNNTWYAGGQQFNNSIWNTMEMRITPKVTGQPNQTANTGYDIYFTNSFQNTNSFCEKEATYETRFNASFPVMGGGNIVFAVHDSNCRTLQNCGAVESQMTCNTAASRVIDMSGLTPAAPASFTQPPTGTVNGATYEIQWEWIDVTSVTCN